MTQPTYHVAPEQPVSQKAPRPSFLCRSKQFMLAMPAELDPATKLLLLALFAHADDHGAGIYVSTEHLCELTGLPRRTVFRHLSLLAERKYLLADGWKEHVPGCRTRLRRLDLEALQRDRRHPAAKPDPSATHGTPAADPSATHGTDPSATHGTLTKRENQKGNLVVPTRRPDGRSDPASLRKIIWSEGVQLAMKLTGRTEKRARGLIGELVRKAGADDPGQVIEVLAQASRTDPSDPTAYMLAAIRPPESKRPMSRAERFRRSLDDPSPEYGA